MVINLDLSNPNMSQIYIYEVWAITKAVKADFPHWRSINQYRYIPEWWHTILSLYMNLQDIPPCDYKPLYQSWCSSQPWLIMCWLIESSVTGSTINQLKLNSHKTKWAYGGLHGFRNGFCCWEGLNSKWKMLHTHIQPGNPEDRYQYAFRMRDLCHQFSIQAKYLCFSSWVAVSENRVAENDSSQLLACWI